MSQRPPVKRSSSTWAAVALVALFLVLVWPVVFTSTGSLGDTTIEGNHYPTSEMGDQRLHHEPTIAEFADEWPRIDLVNYMSATTPGYHIALAVVARYVSRDLVVLQTISSLFGLGLVLAVWHRAAGSAGGWRALGLSLPFLCSSYVIGSSIWLVTDNAALLFVTLAFGGILAADSTVGRSVRSAVYITAAVAVRQIHAWLVGPLVLAVLLASPLQRHAPRAIRAEESKTRGWPGLASCLAVGTLPLVLVGVFFLMWGGLTPPGYLDRHDAGITPATLPVVLALYGAFGLFFVPLLVGNVADLLRPDRRVGIAVILAVAASLLVPTSYDQDAGRWGGALWMLVKHTPSLADRSLVFPPLAAAGAVVLVHAWRTMRRAGRAREAAILMIGLLCWVLAESVNTQSGQRYFEPIVLLSLAWMAAWAGHTTSGDRRWLGPVVLGIVQLGLSMWTVYMPVLSWNPGSQ